MKVGEILAARRRQDRRLDVPATPPGVFAQKRSEPVKLDRQPSTGSSLPVTPSFSRMRSCQPVSAEELRKREVQSLLNKVCPENVASAIEKMSSMEVRTADAMEAVIELIFKKALAEPHHCETYADIVFGLKSAFPEFQSPDVNELMTFKSVVLNICQHEFEELLAAPELSEDERAKLDPEELDYERQERRKRMRAKMPFIGHLFLRQLLPAKVIGSVLCELTLVEQPDILPEEHAIECACELLNAVGFTLKSLPAGREALAAVCGRMHALRHAKTESGKQAYSKHVQFTIQDVLDARSADWTGNAFSTSAKTREDIRLEQAQRAPACPRHQPGFPAGAQIIEQPEHAADLCRPGGDGARAGWDAVLIEGPLQQHAILSFWRQRWCVLARVLGEWELRVYQDKAASLSAVATPVWRGRAGELALVPDAGGQPSTLTCVDLNTGEPVLALRVLAGHQFEQLVAWKLWCAALQAAGLAMDDELA